MINIKISTGIELLHIARTSKGKQPRYEVGLTVDKVLNNKEFKAIAIFGRRVTGKTIFIHHLILELYNRGLRIKDIYLVNIWSSNGKNMKNLLKLTNRLKNKVIIIEGITKLDDFRVTGSTEFIKLITNNYIIMTGSNNYAFKESELCDIVSINNIGYREYISILDEELGGLDNSSKVSYYLKWGKLRERMESDKLSVNQVYSAILYEIVIAVKNNIGFEEVAKYIKRVTKQNEDKLVYTVVRILEDILKLGDISIDIDLDRQAALFMEDAGRPYKMYIPGFGLNHTEVGCVVYTLPHKRNIRDMHRVLVDMQVISEITNIASIYKEKDGEYGIYTGITPSETVCMVNMISFGILKNIQVYGRYDTDSLKGDIEEILLKNLVISQCVTTGYKVNFLKYSLTDMGSKTFGEETKQVRVDCIVTNNLNQLTLINIRNSDKIKNEHSKSLNLKSVEHIVGDTYRKIVVYTGKTKESRRIKYINIHDFFIDIDKWVG